MIKKVKGDILLSETQAIAQIVAPHDHLNQGLALALRDLYPAMAKDFSHYCHQQNPKEGQAWLWGGADKVIINLMAQEAAIDKNAHPGKATMKNLKGALKDLRKLIKKEQLKSVALPKLATGVGGLDWEDVEPLIEQYLGDLKIPVIIYQTYIKDKKAKENLKVTT